MRGRFVALFLVIGLPLLPDAPLRAGGEDCSTDKGSRRVQPESGSERSLTHQAA